MPPRNAGGIGSSAPPSGQVFSEDKLKLRANNMRQEWMQDKNEKELLLSMDEVLASPNAGKVIVQTNIDYAADCKASELKSVIDMIVILYRNRKVTDSEIKTAVGGLVEFVDSFACDNPKIYGYIGDMVCAFINMNALGLDWLCDCTSRVMDESCKPKVIIGTLESIQKSFGPGAVKSCIGNPSERSAMEKLLGPAKVAEIEAQFSG